MSIETDFQVAFSLIQSMLIFLIPLAIIQLVLMITALVSILRHDTYKTGTRLIWILVVIFVNTIGPILYFVLGRNNE